MVAAKRQVPFIELLLPSRCLSAGFVSAGLQLTANATTGKNWMPSVFGFIVGNVNCSSSSLCTTPQRLVCHARRSHQRSHRRKPRNCLVTSNIGDYFA